MFVRFGGFTLKVTAIAGESRGKNPPPFTGEGDPEGVEGATAA